MPVPKRPRRRASSDSCRRGGSRRRSRPHSLSSRAPDRCEPHSQYTSKSKKHIPLHDRIKGSQPNACGALMAIEWLGNAGSHTDELKRYDLFNAFEILELVLRELYVRAQQADRPSHRCDQHSQMAYKGQTISPIARQLVRLRVRRPIGSPCSTWPSLADFLFPLTAGAGRRRGRGRSRSRSSRGRARREPQQERDRHKDQCPMELITLNGDRQLARNAGAQKARTCWACNGAPDETGRRMPARCKSTRRLAQRAHDARLRRPRPVGQGGHVLKTDGREGKRLWIEWSRRYAASDDPRDQQQDR